MTHPEDEQEICRHCDQLIHRDACGCWTHQSGWRCLDGDTLAEPATAGDLPDVPTADRPPRHHRRL